MIYNIYEITGKFATDCDSGQKLYDLIYPHLKQGESVELDFTGVSIFASTFFYANQISLKAHRAQLLNNSKPWASWHCRCFVCK